MPIVSAYFRSLYEAIRRQYVFGWSVRLRVRACSGNGLPSTPYRQRDSSVSPTIVFEGNSGISENFGKCTPLWKFVLHSELRRATSTVAGAVNLVRLTTVASLSR